MTIEKINNNSGGGILPYFYTVTLAEFIALIAAGTLVPGATYAVNYIAVADWGQNITGYFQALTATTFDNEGEAAFYNADYDNIGTYTAPGLTGTNLGIWNTAIAPAVGDVCIYNNKHYKNLTGTNGGSSPNLDLVRWSVLTAAVENGYILETDNIKFDIANDRIIYRSDIRNNIVSGTAIYNFKYGADNTRFNTLSLGNVFTLKNCNNQLEFSGNDITGVGSLELEGYIEFSRNTIKSGTTTFTDNTGVDLNTACSNNIFNLCDIVSNLTNIQITNNECYKSTLNANINFILNFCTLKNTELQINSNNTNITTCYMFDSIVNSNDTMNLSNSYLNNSTLSTNLAFNINNCIYEDSQFVQNIGSGNIINNCKYWYYITSGNTYSNTEQINGCYFGQDKILLKFTKFFTGTPGNGQIGSVDIPNVFINFIGNYLPKSINYFVQVPLVSAAAPCSLTAGSNLFADQLLNAAAGDIFTMNATINTIAAPNNYNRPNGNDILKLDVNFNDITGGLIFITMIYESV